MKSAAIFIISFLLVMQASAQIQSTRTHSFYVTETGFAHIFPVGAQLTALDYLGNEYRTYMGFPVPASASPYVFATLTLATDQYASIEGDAQFKLYSIDAHDPETLTGTDVKTIAFFNDLGDGTAFATEDIGQASNVTLATYTVVLNAAALTEINAHRGGTFGCGLKLTNDSQMLEGSSPGDHVLTLYTSLPNPQTFHAVRFSGGPHGSISGGNAVQSIVDGQAAMAPTITAYSGWTFAGWDTDFSVITSELTATAKYTVTGATPVPGLDILVLHGGNTTDQTYWVSELESYPGAAVTIGPGWHQLTATDLSPYDAVVVAMDSNYSSANDMPAGGQSSLIDFINNGGVVLFTNRFGAKVAANPASFSTLRPILPVTPSTTSYPISNGVNQLVATTSDPNINHHLPPSFTFDEAQLYDVTPLAGSTTYFSGSRSGAFSGKPMVVGWEIGEGFVFHSAMSFSRFQLIDLEISQMLVNLLGLKATPAVPSTSYTVTFVEGAHGSRTGGGDLIQTVTEGNAAVAPVITPDSGWSFTGWDSAFDNITSDLTVTAQYSVATYTVTFNLAPHGTRTGGGSLVQTISHGGAAVAPSFDVASGYGFTGWSSGFGIVTSNLTVNAQYAVDVASAGPEDDAVSSGERNAPPPGDPVTVEVGSLVVTEGGSFVLGENETLQLNDGPLQILAGAIFSANGTILGNVINAGLLRIPIIGLPPTVNTGVIQVFVTGPATIPEIGMSDGLVRFEGPGTVTIDTPIQSNAGVLAMDASLAITGQYEQTSTGSLRMFIAGQDPGISHSQLTTGDDVSLDGTIEIVLQPENLGYFPEPGDTFDLVVTDPTASITLQPGLSVESFVVAGQTAAFDEDGIILTPYDSGLGAGLDPDELLATPPGYFSIALAEGGTVLRATYIGPDLNDFYNERPSDLLASANTVSEGDPVGTVLATLSSIGGAPGTPVFELVAGDGAEDNGDFEIAGNLLRTAREIDFETDSERSIRLRVTDPLGRFLDKIFIVLITNIVTDDDDNDRLTEEEEGLIGTNKLKADTDGDSYDDGEEYLVFGTNPTDPGSFFRYVDGLVISASNASLSWESVAEKTYTMQGSNNPSLGWTDLPNPVAGTGGTVTGDVDLTQHAYKFFRLKVN